MSEGRFEFDTKDRQGFYKTSVVLPAAAVWNMDEFLMAYIAAGLTWLLEEGNVNWDGTGEFYGQPDLKNRMMEARDHAANYRKFNDDDGSLTREQVVEYVERGNTALRLIADFGVQFLWD